MTSPWSSGTDASPPASIVGEIDFGDESVRADIHASEEWVEIYVEADFERLSEGRGASPFSTFHAISLAKPSPQRRDVPRIPVLHPRRDERFRQQG